MKLVEKFINGISIWDYVMVPLCNAWGNPLLCKCAMDSSKDWFCLAHMSNNNYMFSMELVVSYVETNMISK